MQRLAADKRYSSGLTGRSITMISTFTLSREDFTLLQKIIVKRLQRAPGFALKTFPVRVIVWLCIGMAGSAYARLYQMNPDIHRQLGVVGMLILVAILAAVLRPLYSRRLLQRSMLSEDGSFLAQQSVDFTEEGLVVTSRAGRTTLLWSSFLAYGEDAKNHYLFIEPVQAFVLPKSAIANQEQFAKLTSGLKR